ncbi:MAG: GNAT family N-acetyltransferase [Methanomicrobiaceae archaeon]|nr:GNAT family N-acetyltransferase [Methanomicrobiaceae archaeon]
MQIEPDEWLSRILEYGAFRIVKLDQSPELSKEDLINNSENHSSFFFVKVPVIQTGLVHSLCNAGFQVVDVNVTFERKLSLDPNICDTSSELTIRDLRESDHKILLEIAETGFKYSRFHLDPFITLQTANKIKREWLNSYLKGSRGDGIIVAEKDERPVGFLANLHIVDSGQNIRVIDLICVDRDSQKQGIGKEMISHLIKKSSDQFSVLRVGTQIANIPSMSLYSRCKFEIVKAEYVLHAHLKDGVIL